MSKRYVSLTTIEHQYLTKYFININLSSRVFLKTVFSFIHYIPEDLENTLCKFRKIEPEIFGYQIGGYQVCEKWLKERKDRKISLDDIKHYCNIVTAIRKTLEIQKMVDSIYPKLEDEIISNI